MNEEISQLKGNSCPFLVLQQHIVFHLAPDSSMVNRLWLESLLILQTLCRLLSDLISVMFSRWITMIFQAILIPRCTEFLLLAVHKLHLAGFHQHQMGSIQVHTPNFEPSWAFPTKSIQFTTQKVGSLLDPKNSRFSLGIKVGMSSSTGPCTLHRALCWWCFLDQHNSAQNWWERRLVC